jgi:tRNA A37 threonylcarbamoyladenosine synthetase subunit TsaC/SUA5/YrdC
MTVGWSLTRFKIILSPKSMNKILLAQTDTTVGFLSQDATRLKEIKMRSGEKPFLKVYAELKVLTRHIRIPSAHKHRVRHSDKTTFILKNQAFRYVSDPKHAALIKPYGWLYSTSANESGKSFDEAFCRTVSDIIVEDNEGLKEQSASKIFLLNSTRLKQLR